MSERSQNDINVVEMSRNVEELREKLSRTELSLQNLEELSQRELTLEDDNLPPALTMEELMLGSDAESLASYGKPRSSKSDDFTLLQPDPYENSFYSSNSFQSPRKGFDPRTTRSFSSGNFPQRDDNGKIDYRNFKANIQPNSENTQENLNVTELSSDQGNYGSIKGEWGLPLSPRMRSFNSSKEMSSPQRPVSARSNATSVTILGTDPTDDMSQRNLSENVTQLKLDNVRLKTLVSQLREQVNDYSEIAPGTQDLSLREIIASLKDEVKANEHTLRKTEDKLDYHEVISAEKDGVIAQLRNELVHLKTLLEGCDAKRIEAESSRDRTFNESAKLTERFGKIHESMSAKLSQTRSLHKSLVQANHDKAILAKNCEAAELKMKKLENDLRSCGQKLSTSQRKLMTSEEKLMTSQQSMRSCESESKRMLERAQMQIRELVGELEVKHAQIKKSKSENSEISENRHKLQIRCSDLEGQLERFKSMLTTSQRELEGTKLEVERISQSQNNQRNALDDMTNIRTPEPVSPRKHRAQISELNMKLAAKESQIQRLEARVKSYAIESEKIEEIRGELLTVVEKSREGERRSNELENIIHRLEDEKTRITKQLNETEDTLHDKISECDSLEARLSERTNLLSKNQIELEELNRKLTKVKSEMKERNNSLSTISKELDGKCKESSELSEKLSELEKLLEEKTQALMSAAEWSSKQESDLKREIRKLKSFHTGQSRELIDQNESLQSEADNWKQKATSLKNQTSRLNDALVASSNRIRELERAIDELTENGRLQIQAHSKAVESLEEKCSLSSNRVVALEQALSQCKSELTNHVARLNEAESDFQHQMALKSDQIKKLEMELKLSLASLSDESKRLTELETALSERHVMLERASTRISELEDSQSTLETQVAKQQQKSAKDSMNFKKIIQEFERKCKMASDEIENKNLQFKELNEALRQVDGDFQLCKSELCSLEREVVGLRSEGEGKSQELTRVKYEWGEMKGQLDRKIELVASLQEDMKKSERKRKKLEEKSLKLETELTEARCHAQETTHHNQELENFSRNRNAEILKKDEMINKLQDALQASKGAHEWLEDEKRRLERLLEERQWELRQRATQLSELGGQLQEFRNTTEKRNAELENELQCSQCQLKERNQQVKELDERYSVAREETRELLRRQEEWEQSVRRSEKEQEQKEKRIRELEKSVDEERRAREERHQTCLGTTQQLRVAREREQNMARQIQDCDREIGRLNREMEQLMVEVEELGSENKEKDERLQRVVKQIGEISTEKLAIETRYRDEMDRIEKDVDKIREQHREKVENLESEISNLRVRASVANGNQEQAISSATQLEQLMRDENHRTKQTMEALERELVARKQVIESANDAIIMKDAEIARLQAKYSGLERGVAMSSLPNTPVKLQCQENISQDPAHTPTFLRESPWTHKDDNTTNSLFNGFESEIGSLAPSFVPIAASTKRLPATNQSEVDSSSFFVTSSPTPDNNADVIMSDFSLEDDSLYKRVFADTVHASPSSRESRKVNKVLHFDQSDVTLRPEKCMADLQEKLRASEQRRRDVTSKLRHLKSASSNT